MNPKIKDKKKDLLLHLISLRLNTEIVPDFGSDIPLKTNEFIGSNFSTNENEKYEEIFKVLETIEEDDLDIEGYTTIKKLIRKDDEKIIIIKGASTKKLKYYTKIRL